MRLLLDEHLPAVLAQEIVRHRAGAEAVALRDFEGGIHLGARDETILDAAASAGFTLVTYDLRTVPPILKTWGEQAVSHGGVIFIDRHTLEPSDIGGLLRALSKVWDELGTADWADRVVYLSR